MQSCADFEGVTFSEFVRRAVLEKIEDMADVEAYNQAIDDADTTRYTMSEVKEMIFS